MELKSHPRVLSCGAGEEERGELYENGELGIELKRGVLALTAPDVSVCSGCRGRASGRPPIYIMIECPSERKRSYGGRKLLEHSFTSTGADFRVPSINHSLWNGVHQREILYLADILGRLRSELEDELNAQAVTEENTPVLFLVNFRAAATKLDFADKFNLRGKLEVLVLQSLKIW